MFLPRAHPRLSDLLRGKAAAGCKIRIALADPNSPQVAQRDAEEHLRGSPAARIRNSLVLFAPLLDCEGIAIHKDAAPLHNSVFRFDDEMLVTPHLYGAPDGWAPLLHLRRLGGEGIFDRFATYFEDIWAISKPVDPA